MNNGENGIVKLYIKNMVCPRCIEAVRGALADAGVEVMSVTLGEAEIVGEPDAERKRALAARLEKSGFELLEDRRSRIISSVKNGIVELIYSHEVVPDVCRSICRIACTLITNISARYSPKPRGVPSRSISSRRRSSASRSC